VNAFFVMAVSSIIAADWITSIFSCRRNFSFFFQSWEQKKNPPYSPDLSLCDFFCSHDWKKNAKITATWEYRGCSSGCDGGAHSHSERAIHQMLPGLAEKLATVYYSLRWELLWRGQEPLVNKLNFVIFTDSVSLLYGQRVYNTDVIFK
jgi:hypothetical protein